MITPAEWFIIAYYCIVPMMLFWFFEDAGPHINRPDADGRDHFYPTNLNRFVSAVLAIAVMLIVTTGFEAAGWLQ